MPDLGFRDSQKYLTWVLPLKTSLARVDYIMSLSTYMAPTRVPTLRCSGNLCVLSRSFLIRQIRIEVAASFASYVFGKGI